ncbi:putative methyltransferase-like protein 24 [Saccoglossus kowalevskii]
MEGITKTIDNPNPDIEQGPKIAMFDEWEESPIIAHQYALSNKEGLRLVPTNYKMEVGDDVTPEQTMYLVTNYTTNITYTCQSDIRFGNKAEGGWNVCMDVGITPGACIVYSIGIGNDWSFDQDMAKYGCNVYSFDPTIGLDDHKHANRIWFYNIGLYGENVEQLSVSGKQWKVRTLSYIRKMLHHENNTIDVLKFDIECGEHQVFHQLIRSGILWDIKIVAFELHLGTILRDKESHLNLYRALHMAFEENGFKLWRWHEDEELAMRNPNIRLGWIEVYWVNMKFINQNN